MDEFWVAAIVSFIIATCGHDPDIRGLGWACCIGFAMVCLAVVVTDKLFGWLFG